MLKSLLRKFRPDVAHGLPHKHMSFIEGQEFMEQNPHWVWIEDLFPYLELKLDGDAVQFLRAQTAKMRGEGYGIVAEIPGQLVVMFNRLMKAMLANISEQKQDS